MALSADGKIAPVERTAPHFGEADARRFEQLCAAADALVLGAGTLRAQGATRSIVRPELLAQRRAAGLPDQPLTVVVSASGELDLDLPFFTRQRVPRAVATLDGQVRAAVDRYGSLAEVWGCGPERVTVAAVLARLAARGCERLALLGGGALNADWFAAGAVDVLELTLAPVLFGGAAAPTPCDGAGLAVPAGLVLTRCEVAPGGVVFLTYHAQQRRATQG